MKRALPLIEHFSALEDYRDTRYVRHSLLSIIGISICAIICGAEDWYDVEDYAIVKKDWLKSFLDIGDCTPSHDTLERFFGMVNPDKLECCFRNWVKSIGELTEGSLVHIDGKTLRGSGTSTGTGFVHMVSAWCSSTGLVLGQQKVEEKSNEITAIPELLESLLAKGCVVTIDAMGCQTEIAEKIINTGSDYILAVKENQKFLYQDIEEAFSNDKCINEYMSSEVGHGRIEKRITSVITDIDWICKQENWKSLNSLIRVIAIRNNKKTGEQQQSTRYYISSKKGTAEWFSHAIRSHWSIENQLHWVLDVAFNEDASKKRRQNSAQNFSLLNKIALNALKHYEKPGYTKKQKISIKRKRKMAGWDNNIALQIALSIS